MRKQIYIYIFFLAIHIRFSFYIGHTSIFASLSLSLSKIDFVYFSPHESHVPLLLVLSILTADGS